MEEYLRRGTYANVDDAELVPNLGERQHLSMTEQQIHSMVDIIENLRVVLPPSQIGQRISYEKAEAVTSGNDEHLVVSVPAIRHSMTTSNCRSLA